MDYLTLLHSLDSLFLSSRQLPSTMSTATPSTRPAYIPTFETDPDRLASADQFFETEPPISLSPNACITLEKLKTRCASAIHRLQDDWYLDYSKLKQDAPFNKLLHVVGYLLTMPTNWATMVLEAGQGKRPEKAGQIKSKRCKDLIHKLQKLTESEMRHVEWLWRLLNQRKSRNSVMEEYFKDLGVMMQHSDKEIGEIFRILNRLIRSGEIKHSANRYMYISRVPTKEEVCGQSVDENGAYNRGGGKQGKSLA